MCNLVAGESARDCVRRLVTLGLLLCALGAGCKAEEPGDDSQGGVGGAAGALPTAGMLAGTGGMAGIGGAAGMAGTAGMAGMSTSGSGSGSGGAGAGAGGMSGMGGTEPTLAPTFSAIFSEIFAGPGANCVFCHRGEPSSVANGNLQIHQDMKQASYDHLVNVMSTSDLCAGMTLVIPGNAAGSLLIQKLSATPPCGLRMPIGLPLTDAQMMQITTWINNGAMFD